MMKLRKAALVFLVALLLGAVVPPLSADDGPPPDCFDIECITFIWQGRTITLCIKVFRPCTWPLPNCPPESYQS